MARRGEALMKVDDMVSLFLPSLVGVKYRHILIVNFQLSLDIPN